MVGDITCFDSESIPPHDVLTGGFCCQSFSMYAPPAPCVPLCVPLCGPSSPASRLAQQSRVSPRLRIVRRVGTRLTHRPLIAHGRSMGEEKGFDDSRGELFFEIVRILRHHQPKAFLLENVANVVTHDDGRTLDVILQQLRAAGCDISHPSPELCRHLAPPRLAHAWLTTPNRWGCIGSSANAFTQWMMEPAHSLVGSTKRLHPWRAVRSV